MIQLIYETYCGDENNNFHKLNVAAQKNVAIFRNKNSALEILMKWNNLGSIGGIKWVYSPIDILYIHPEDSHNYELHPDDSLGKTMTIKINDKVAYSVQWLKSTGQSHGYMSQARGVVTDLIPLGNNFLAVVEWNDEDIPKKVLAQNLAIVGPNTKFCQC